MNVDRLTNWFASRINPERPANGPPPGQLAAFMRWAIAGCWPVKIGRASCRERV